MRQLFLGTIASVTLLPLGGSALPWQAGHYRNVAGPITGSYSAGINGTFRVEADPSGIPSDRYGGACIVFRAKDLGFTEMQHKNCRKDGDCDAGGHSGYCDVLNGKCWAKPVLPDPNSADAAV